MRILRQRKAKCRAVREAPAQCEGGRKARALAGRWETPRQTPPDLVTEGEHRDGTQSRARIPPEIDRDLRRDGTPRIGGQRGHHQRDRWRFRGHHLAGEPAPRHAARPPMPSQRASAAGDTRSGHHYNAAPNRARHRCRTGHSGLPCSGGHHSRPDCGQRLAPGDARRRAAAPLSHHRPQYAGADAALAPTQRELCTHGAQARPPGAAVAVRRRRGGADRLGGSAQRGLFLRGVARRHGGRRRRRLA